MFTHSVALMAGIAVAYLIHFLFGEYLSLPLEFLICLVIGGGVYIFAFIKLKQALS